MTIILEKKINAPYKKVMLTESLYSLALYLFIEKKQEETLFLIGNNVDFSNVKKELSNYIIYDKDSVQWNGVLLRSVKNGKYPGIYQPFEALFRGVQAFYGHDHISLSPLLREKKMILIEDGTSNYPSLAKSWKKLIKHFLGFGYVSMGFDQRVSQIYLTGILPIPKALKEKVSLIDRKLFVSEIPKLLSGTFAEKVDIIQSFQLLITQPLSEDKWLTEEEKIAFYRKMVDPTLKLVIKPHPREKTIYHDAFSQAIVLKKGTLVESLFENPYLKRVSTAFSTAPIGYPFGKEISIDIDMNKLSKRLSKKDFT